MIMKYLKKIIGTLLFAATVFLTACGPSGSGSGSIVDIGGIIQKYYCCHYTA